MTNQQLSLYELNNQIKASLGDRFPMPVWVVAEISELKVNSSGHCYLELIEKDADSDKVIARSRAMVWSFTFRILEPYFKTSTGTDLKEGMKVMVHVTIEFHEIYGLSLNIRDIDPAYTIGDLARKRQEIIRQLEEEGVIHMNKELVLPEVIQKIAIISSKSAAGLGDFLNQIESNEFGYQFHLQLFESGMQGENASASIIASLDAIFEQHDAFDVVIIIRGGGAKADLLCFDEYWLAYHITQFPLPVITGIGHERDDTIADLVAHVNVKTPTAVAEYILDHNFNFEQQLLEYEGWIHENVKEILNNETIDLENLTYRLPGIIQSTLYRYYDYLTRKTFELQSSSKSSVNSAYSFLDEKKYAVYEHAKRSIQNMSSLLIFNESMLLNKVKNNIRIAKTGLDHKQSLLEKLDVTNVLKRGFTLIEQDQSLVKSRKSFKLSEKFSIVFHDGKISGELNSE